MAMHGVSRLRTPPGGAYGQVACGKAATPKTQWTRDRTLVTCRLCISDLAAEDARLSRCGNAEVVP